MYHIILHNTTLHYTTLHYTTLHCTTLHYTTLHYTTLHYTTLHCLHYTTLHCFTLHYTTLYYTTLHYTTLLCTVLYCHLKVYRPLRLPIIICISSRSLFFCLSSSFFSLLSFLFLCFFTCCPQTVPHWLKTENKNLNSQFSLFQLIETETISMKKWGFHLQFSVD